MAIAALWGTTVGYSEAYEGRVTIETVDGRVAVVNKETFDYLYHKLDDFTAALKEDCIQYAINLYDDRCILEYPEWYVDACTDGIIYESCCTLMLYEESGEIAMSRNSVVLRNYKGELRHIEAYKFHQYYDTLRE